MRSKIRGAARSLLRMLLPLYIIIVLFVGISDKMVPDKLTIRRNDLADASVNVAGVNDSCTVEAKLFGIIPIKDVAVTVIDDNKLVPGGNVFGVKFFTKGVMVIKMSDIETADGNVNPAKKAGLEVGNIIKTVDGIEVNTVEDLSRIIEHSYGRTLKVQYTDDGEEKLTHLTPVLSLTDKKYKTGIWVRDSTAGIGTVTFYNPVTGGFAGLGHGICDTDTGKLMPLLRGSVVDVEITDVVKGKKGLPGEIKGNFDTCKKGVLTENTEKGVYGVMDQVEINDFEDALDIALKEEVKKGKAYILSELDEDGVGKYEIQIERIEEDDEEYKNFVIKVTDNRLVEKTGGIVQGMSGSPIVQNGKLVGAVTHVFVNDPTRGYGIFIENMLSEGEN